MLVYAWRMHPAGPASRLVRIVGRRRPPPSTALLYHGVGAPRGGRDPHELCVSEQRFRRHLDVLERSGCRFATVSDLVDEAARRGAAPAPGRVALTFDDGMADNHATLMPILRERGATATVYVATGLIGRPNPWLPGTGERMMTAGELRELHAAGIELGAHTVSHPDLVVLDEATVEDEVRRSRATLEDLIGAPVRSFAYPYGRTGPAAAAAVRAAGFDSAVGISAAAGWSDPYEVGRLVVPPRTGPTALRLQIAGAYWPAYNSHAGRAARATTRAARRRLRAR